MAIKQFTIKLERAGTTGWTAPVAVPGLKSAGQLLGVQVREDPTLDDATAATVYLCDAEDGDLAAAPPDHQTFYESDSITLTGSAKAASKIEPLTSAPYSTRPGSSIKVVANITATAGGTTTELYVTIRADVEE